MAREEGRRSRSPRRPRRPPARHLPLRRPGGRPPQRRRPRRGHRGDAHPRPRRLAKPHGEERWSEAAADRTPRRRVEHRWMDERSERIARRLEPLLLIAALLVIPVIVIEEST